MVLGLPNAVQREGCSMPGEGIWERLIPSLHKSLVSLSCPQSSLLCRMPPLTFLIPHPCMSLMMQQAPTTAQRLLSQHKCWGIH